MTECLQLAKQELGLDAMIVSKRTFRKGAMFGRWGGKPMVEVTFGTYRAPAALHSAPAPPVVKPENDPSLQKLEARVASLADSVQNLLETGQAASSKSHASDFVSAPYEARAQNGSILPAPVSETPATSNSPAKPFLGRRLPPVEPPLPEGRYSALLCQLQDADVALPLARQLLTDLPDGLPTADAAAELRTMISQRLRVAHRPQVGPGTDMQIMAFVGTTGVGKTTTVVKLAAQFALLERRRVGMITLDTNRIAAAQQLQTYGQILRVPVEIAHDRVELLQHLAAFRANGTEIVLIDTAGRSPNDMLPMGEAAHLFEDIGPVQTLLAASATLAARDLENSVARFQSILRPDALILTKLDEACDNTCFGRLLTMQAKYGLPLAYVTTGQKVPDDILYPDPHAIAARILSGASL